MLLKEEFERTGNRFFRWRSYLPLFMALLFLLALLYRRAPDPRFDGRWEFACLGVSLLGLAIRFFTVGYVPRGTSGRNTLEQVADALNTTGMYSVVRNPIYLGNFIIWFGLSLFMKLWWFTIIIILSFILFYERIIFAEEEFLREKFGVEFIRWAQETPAIIPKFKNWRPPVLAFSWKSALNREYGTFFAIIATFTVLELMGGSWAAGKITLNTTWLIIFLFSACIYLTIRYLKKKTRVLSTVDR